jgi:cytochrome c5
MWKKKRISPGLLILLLGLLFIALPVLAQDGNPAGPYVGPIERGNWTGQAYFGPADNQYVAKLRFTVAQDNAISGRLIFVFQYANMSSQLRTLMAQHGCVADISQITPETLPVSGYFASATEAVGQFTVIRCFLEGYGELKFARPVSGVWLAKAGRTQNDVFLMESTPVAVASTPAAVTTPEPTIPSPTTGAPAVATTASAASGEAELAAFGTKTYKAKCSECHGLEGEGREPDVRDLGATRVKRMSDENLLKAIDFGVEGTEMEPYRAQLTPLEKQALIYLIRHIDLLR